VRDADANRLDQSLRNAASTHRRTPLIVQSPLGRIVSKIWVMR